MLNEDDSTIVKGFIKRQKTVRTYIAVSMPLVSFSAFAINRYHLGMGNHKNMLACGILNWFLYQGFNYSIKQDKLREYSLIYSNYKDIVTKSNFRGIKAFKGKHVNKIVEREFTSSNLDDLKVLLDNNK